MIRSRLSLCGIVLIAALMLSGGAAIAATYQSDTANYVMPGCRTYVSEPPIQGDLFKTGWCAGLVAGLVFTATGSCIPPEATKSQTVRVVLQYIDARPSRMHEDFTTLALEALKAAWPCKR
jgi:hypothetical protein